MHVSSQLLVAFRKTTQPDIFNSLLFCWYRSKRWCRTVLHDT